MFSPKVIIHLYKNVLDNDMGQYNVPHEAVRLGIEAMAHVYKPDTVSLNSGRSMVADYNDVAHRCAYLHKYAALHTAMVQDMFSEALRTDFDFFSRWVFSEDCVKICSLGGGPGSDVIGIMSALHEAFSFFPASVAVVDYMFNWTYTFDSILRELGSGWYGPFGRYMCFDVDSRYVGANLLKSLQPEVIDVLSEASIVSMIKFASAAACQDTDIMMKNIFKAMKPGAMVLFIDNAGGGFHKVFVEAAVKYKFRTIYGPFEHKNYDKPEMMVKQFGYVSCHKTTVTVHIIQKPMDFRPLQVMPYHYGPYQSPYAGNHRRVIYNSPYIGSPPTPLLFNPSVPALLPSPPTPMLFCPSPPALLPSPYPQPGCNFTQDVDYRSFTEDVDYRKLDIRSPLQDISQMSTPAGGKRKRRKMQGCLPVRLFKNHLARKVNQFKFRARAIFKKKVKSGAGHPIFKL